MLDYAALDVEVLFIDLLYLTEMKISAVLC